MSSLDKGAKDPSVKAKRKLNKLAGITSICILLIPPFIYAALYFINKFFEGATALWAGLSFDASLFVSSYLACVLLFLIGFFTKIIGLSLMTLFGNMSEDFIDDAFEKKDSREENPIFASDAELPANQ